MLMTVKHSRVTRVHWHPLKKKWPLVSFSLALAVTLFWLMVAGLPSSGFDSERSLWHVGNQTNHVFIKTAFRSSSAFLTLCFLINP